MSETKRGPAAEDLTRGRPTHALGGGARKDHLFSDKKSLCGKYLYGGGYSVKAENLDGDDEDLCKACRRAAGLVE